MLEMHELLHDLEIVQIPLEFQRARAAESAAHGAAGLAGNAGGEFPFPVGQQDTLDYVAVVQLQSKLGGPVRVALAGQHLA